MKKVISMVMTVWLAFTLGTIVFASDSQSLTVKEIESIITQSILDKTGESDVEVSIIRLNNSTSLQTLNSSATAKGVKTVKKLGNGRIKVAVTAPYLVLDDGTLVNSFAYVEANSVNGTYEGTTVTYDFIDIDITLSGYYSKEGMIADIGWMYKMYDASFNWGKRVGENPDVISADLSSNVKGELYSYTSSDDATLIDADYSDHTDLHINNPGESSTYYTELVMDPNVNEAVYPSSSVHKHGGYPSVDFKYYDNNGNLRSDTFFFYVFSK